MRPFLMALALGLLIAGCSTLCGISASLPGCPAPVATPAAQ